jgi:2-polyprenyl-6-hydroxyphenyl methylase/3-demethylubiquinone-9 3-methyltransferase
MLRKDTLKTRDPAVPTSDAAEIAKFNALAEEWWNPNGKFKVVHAFNAARVSYLIPHIASQLGGPREADRPLDGIRIADIGCGAGLVSEPLASAGAHVFAIDAAERNVAIARHHAAQSGVDTIAYETALPEQLGSDHTGAYDAVLSLEVVEHVAGVDAFLAALARLVRPGGIMVIGTLNRTAKSFAFRYRRRGIRSAIVAGRNPCLEQVRPAIRVGHGARTARLHARGTRWRFDEPDHVVLVYWQ